MGTMYFLFSFFLKNLFILFILFLAALGPRRCTRGPPSRGERGPLAAAAPGPPIAVASPAAEHGLQVRGLQSAGSAVGTHRAQLLHGVWDLPGPGLKPMSPALAGSLPTIVPPGKPPEFFDFNFS